MQIINFSNITGFSKYQVSACAKIRNIATGKILNNNSLSSGYQIVRIKNDDGLIKPVYVHHIVAKTFIPFIEGYEIDHIDRDKSNNNLTNLRYLTRSQNCLNQGPRNKLYKGVYKKHSKYEVRVCRRYIGVYNSEREAAEAYNIAAAAHSEYCYLNVIV